MSKVSAKIYCGRLRIKKCRVCSIFRVCLDEEKDDLETDKQVNEDAKRIIEKVAVT